MILSRESEQIRFVCRHNAEYPQETISENKEDVYILSSPFCRGRARIEVNGQVLHDGEVRPGMVRLTAPGERVRTTITSPSRAAVLLIPGVTLRNILDQQEYQHRRGKVSYIDPLLKPSCLVERICAMLLSASELDPEHRQLFVDGLAHSLMACLLDNHAGGQNVRQCARGGELSDAELERCVEYADAKMSERLDLAAWAGVIGVTAAEFARRFQRKTHQAPYTWFMDWRIDRAKQLLHDSTFTVAEIALQTGFCSQSHFTAAFRRRAGSSPGRWRSRRLAPGS